MSQRRGDAAAAAAAAAAAVAVAAFPRSHVFMWHQGPPSSDLMVTSSCAPCYQGPSSLLQTRVSLSIYTQLLRSHLTRHLFCSTAMALKVAVFLLACVLLVSTEADLAQPPTLAPSPAGPGPHLVKDWRECPGLCKERCKLHSRQNRCNRACNTCCAQCKCVPPGTAGNKELCGRCYAEWPTHGNLTNKCP